MYSEEIVDTILKLYPRASRFCLEVYEHVPGSIEAYRATFFTDRKDLKRKVIKLVKNKKPHQGIGLNSSITIGRKIFHIPMIDFKIGVSRANLNYIIKEIESVGYSGLIVQSGRSYHFYGSDPLDYSNWIKFMGTTLRFNAVKVNRAKKVVDQRWIGANLLREYGTLRISLTDTKKFLPKIVYLID